MGSPSIRGAWMGMAAFFLDNILSSALVAILPDTRSRLDLSIETTGWILTTRSFTQVLYSLFVVHWVISKLGKKHTMILSCLLQVSTCLLTAFAENIVLFITAQVVHAMGGSCFSTAAVALIAENPDENDRGRLMGLLYSGVAWGSIVGTAAGGVSYEQFGQRAIFAGIAVLMTLLGGLMASVLVEDSQNVQAARIELRPSLILRLVKHPEIFKALYLIAVTNFALGAFFVLLPAYLADEFAWSSADIGYAMIGGPMVYILLSYSVSALLHNTSKTVLARGTLAACIVCFSALVINKVRGNVYAVIALFTALYGVTAAVQVVQPGVVAAVLHTAALEIPQTAGAALVDVAIGAGYTTMVLTAWVRGIAGYTGAFIYAATVVSTALLATTKARRLRPVRMLSEE